MKYKGDFWVQFQAKNLISKLNDLGIKMILICLFANVLSKSYFSAFFEVWPNANIELSQLESEKTELLKSIAEKETTQKVAVSVECS